MLFGITIVAYNKNLWFTHVVKKTLESTLAQKYTNWKVYFVGDQYYPESQFQQLVKLFPPDKIVAENLPLALERTCMSGQDLWHHGGTNALNHSLKLQRRDGIEMTTHLDHDDIWRRDHLETLFEFYTKFPEAVFIYTQAAYKNSVMPSRNVPIAYDNLIPYPMSLVHSSTSWKLDALKFNYEIHPGYPGDANMWARIREFCMKNKLKTLYVPRCTVEHLEEG